MAFKATTTTTAPTAETVEAGQRVNTIENREIIAFDMECHDPFSSSNLASTSLRDDTVVYNGAPYSVILFYDL